jgi:hypothetical protein
MRTLTKYLAAAVILGATAGAAQAAVSVGFNFGDVAIGYSDGYYDHGHRWHNWRGRDDAEFWRRSHYRDYHNWRHDDRRWWRHW